MTPRRGAAVLFKPCGGGSGRGGGGGVGGTGGVGGGDGGCEQW